MTRERAKELAPIIQAFGEGKTIEYRSSVGEAWYPLTIPSFNEIDGDYRIKPEPKTRPMTRGEVLYKVTTTPAMVCRHKGMDTYYLPGRMSDDIQFDDYEYAIIDKSGNPVDGWHKFEVTE